MKPERHLGCAVMAVAAVLALAGTASGAGIGGKVVVSGAPAADVVVSIEGLKVEAPPDATIYVIDHRDLAFAPHVLVVRAGSSVQFRNSDGMPCRIYSISTAGIFVLTRQDGNPVSIAFDRPGVIEIRCADHPRILAYLLVKENPYFALTDSQGRYEISNLPPGRYALQAWYEGHVIKHKTIELRAGRRTVDLRASRPRTSAETAPPTGLSLISPSSWRSEP